MTGLLLAGIGVCPIPTYSRRGSRLNMQKQHVTQPPEAKKNFLVVDAKTDDSTIEQAFDNFTQKRKDIAILLINQHVRQDSEGELVTSQL